jgi:hypothetical protein
VNSNWHLLYYIKQDGTKPVEEYIRKLSVNEREKTFAFIEHLKEKGPDLHRPYADLLEDGIEIRGLL